MTDRPNMKKILVLILVALCIDFSFVFGLSKSDSDNDNAENIVCRSLPDTVYSLLKNKPVIFYSYGHYGYSWSLIAKTDSVYRAFSGGVDYGGGIHVNDSSESDQFDTTLLFSKYRNLLSWGFDTLSSEVSNMKKVKRKQYVTFYTNLSVINSDGISMFSSDDAVAYSGPDSVEFNKKFHKLGLIMWWISSSKIRQ